MGFDVAAVELPDLVEAACGDQRVEDATPDATAAPAVPAIGDGGVGPVLGRAVVPTSARAQHVHDARDHPPVVHAPGARLVLRQVRRDDRPRLAGPPEQRFRHHQPPVQHRAGTPSIAESTRDQPVDQVWILGKIPQYKSHK